MTNQPQMSDDQDDRDDQQDAARYRWLRTWGNAILSETSPWCIQWVDKTKEETEPLWGEELDAAIDAAMESPQ